MLSRLSFLLHTCVHTEIFTVNYYCLCLWLDEWCIFKVIHFKSLNWNVKNLSMYEIKLHTTESVCTHLFVDVSQLVNKNRLCVLSVEYSLYMTLHQLLIFWCSANNINCDKKCSYLYRGWVDPSVRRPSKLLQDCILDKIPFRIQQG